MVFNPACRKGSKNDKNSSRPDRQSVEGDLSYRLPAAKLPRTLGKRPAPVKMWGKFIFHFKIKELNI
jgi:hypothetical protein